MLFIEFWPLSILSNIRKRKCIRNLRGRHKMVQTSRSWFLDVVRERINSILTWLRGGGVLRPSGARQLSNVDKNFLLTVLMPVCWWNRKSTIWMWFLVIRFYVWNDYRKSGWPFFLSSKCGPRKRPVVISGSFSVPLKLQYARKLCRICSV